MEKEFIPYEQALALKELGFDKEICFGRWTTYPDGEGFLDTTKHSIYQGRDDLNRQCLAPLYQQAFRWFREKYNLDSFVKHLYKSTIKVGYYFGIDEYNGIEFQMELDGYYETYEEAELECLKKLISIVKNKQ
jgi:hypothetical protein